MAKISCVAYTYTTGTWLWGGCLFLLERARLSPFSPIHRSYLQTETHVSSFMSTVPQRQDRSSYKPRKLEPVALGTKNLVARRGVGMYDQSLRSFPPARGQKKHCTQDCALFRSPFCSKRVRYVLDSRHQQCRGLPRIKIHFRERENCVVR